jgi:hypothetical protein
MLTYLVRIQQNTLISQTLIYSTEKKILHLFSRLYCLLFYRYHLRLFYNIENFKVNKSY